MNIRLPRAGSFKDFFSAESSGGVILIICVIISMLIANSPYGDAYSAFLNTSIGTEQYGLGLQYPLLLWINDGLMAIFFLLAGLEIKRELSEGALSSPRQAALPVFAAAGGMLVPALIFALFNNNTPTAQGWGIPVATDIAFAVAIVSLLGSGIPAALRIFLTALAIADDLGAIIIIAIFYSDELHMSSLVFACGILILLIILNRLKVRNYLFYIVPGIVMWYFIHHSGIHSTIAGVLTALTIPAASDSTPSPLEKLERHLYRPVDFLIMPIFALANTNILFTSDMPEGLHSRLGLGIIAGLLLGKPAGIFLMSWVAVKTRLGVLPKGTTWMQIIGLGTLAGIGFTMSIFIATLSFTDPALQAIAKCAVLTASVIAAISGYCILKFQRSRNS